MRKEFLPFCLPSIDESDVEAVVGVLRSHWITTGPRVAELERRVAEFTGAKAAVAVNSATAGMHLVLEALGIGPGDEVITPSMTWVSTVNLIELRGARPVFADVDIDTLMVTPETVLPRITERTRLIIPVHFAGAPVDLAPLRRLAAERGVPLVEDAAHAIGTEYEGVPIGRDGTAIFSFHPIKNMTTGEGGIVCSDDDALLERVRRLRFHGLGVDAFDRAQQGRSPQAEVLEPGYKYNLTDMSAALGCSQIARLGDFLRRRAELAAMYSARLENVPGVLPLRVPGYALRHAWHLYIVRIDPDVHGISRAAFMDALRERNIGSGIHFRAVHTQKHYRERYPDVDGLPATEWNSERVCSLPLFPDMTENDIADVVSSVREILECLHA